ncbi:bifunctional 2-polyprenyl-6-hydroxyphenol methylase/3-demethylubiquinol 3-O-methyltransferase UbiG [Erythrobacter sp. YT30]|uniref:class I SAM-dependent methyltransferase n=1 Tax=Erythrobacter sp. YT30 TaxID=1735012 RepID=UPI00076D1753|nr:class I SAM-dependent methyltransferase [Erythrobacter sp. YT30]KWV91368.1 hypothetical protein AUC45_08845 [Erythrobacter sp. YT30]
MMKKLSCDCCQATMQIVGDHKGFQHFRCPECNYERFKSHEAVQSSDYEEDMDYLDDISVYPSVDDRILWHHKHALQLLRDCNDNALRVLDVGCFDGFFVRKLKDHGIEAYGIDFNRKAIADGAERFSLEDRLSTKTTQEILAEGGRFDAVTMFEVIEHLEDFQQVLKDCKSLLKPGGLFIISAPNNDMSWRPPLDYPPHHLSRFSPKSLDKLVQKHGLRPLATIEQASLYDLIRHFVGLRFRNNDADSLRGGEFKNRKLVDPLRKFATRSKWIAYQLVSPIDKILHLFGFRYIGQIMIAENPKS